jgi:hypothetical protein
LLSAPASQPLRLLFFLYQDVPQSCAAKEVGHMGLLEENILAKRGRIGISGQALAAVLEISETFLSRGLSGVRPLSGPELLRIDTTLNRLIDIAEIIRPPQLPISDVASLKVLLQRYSDNGLAELRNIDALTELRAQIHGLQRV